MAQLKFITITILFKLLNYFQQFKKTPKLVLKKLRKRKRKSSTGKKEIKKDSIPATRNNVNKFAKKKYKDIN